MPERHVERGRVYDLITVQGPAPVGRPPAQLNLAPGESATVGVCRCGSCDLSLRVDDVGAEAFAAQITAAHGYWLVANLSAHHPMTVENVDDRNQYLIVDPGRQGMPVPFELSQVGPAAAPSAPKVVVFGAEPRSAPSRARACPAARTRPFLDSGALYFRVLRELCRPRLQGRWGAPLPTSSTIATTLSTGSQPLSTRAVDAHIRYVSQKVGLSPGSGREALVALAIRSGVFLR
ncbi:hypothetical protein Xcel_0099 [Xylanimonas cellulosilytica DSM 15894]|uniref:Uncharacterized protein n=1 Tax=Xylanimonas cellulosilytica (strain DSM 15894 / JCM 12276 / CECT 5975 / KCTC 9989 / LMG 20990 / NBRC 107835 / XIL07) TaxID=446471 RepID=D1BTX6_XYLCX|nr:hypothetical protein [Xylanimonas cellulosilytica]ACZ29140.1 hypothetical protein Xcel_0099 [Xylanimonas cellulosilytica DSM 15894]